MIAGEHHQHPSSVEGVSNQPPVEAPALSGISKALDFVGRALITLGLLMLAFVGYQLWGTGIHESREQDSLKSSFEKAAAQTPESNVAPVEGEGIGRIVIPKLKVDKFIVAGVDYKSLKKGPGLFPNSPMPGQLGNVAIAGHRTTFGSPFERIDELTVGDTIQLVTAKKTFTYVVTQNPVIVRPTKVEVVKTTDKTRAKLTLVSCHPKWTAANRIIVTAYISGTDQPEKATPFVPSATATSSKATDNFEEGWFHDPQAWPAVLFYGALLSLIGAVSVLFVKLGRGRKVVYPPALVLFLMTLYPFFENLSRLLPSNL